MTAFYTKKASNGFELVKERDIFRQPLTSSEEELSDDDVDLEKAGASTSHENTEADKKPSTSKEDTKKEEAPSEKKEGGAEGDSEEEKPVSALATGFAALRVAFNSVRNYFSSE